jgi:hypothetical protein
MKLIERIAYISFWINIFFVIFVYIGMPILFINVPEFFDMWMADQGRNPINISFTILSSAVLFHWGYCIWFLFKYDRYSKSVFPLFFLSIIYAPIYYYRVKIKKRPLRNKINKPIEPVTEDYSISDSEFIEFTRDNIIQVLNLWASKVGQLELQKSIPKTEVTSELFDYWCDYSMADSEVLSEAFKPEELEILSGFNEEISIVENKFNREFPDIEEFQETSEWNSLNQLAFDITRKLNKENTVGNNK